MGAIDAAYAISAALEKNFTLTSVDLRCMLILCSFCFVKKSLQGIKLETMESNLLLACWKKILQLHTFV